jgi:hypothetical protein
LSFSVKIFKSLSEYHGTGKKSIIGEVSPISGSPGEFVDFKGK